MVSKKCASPLRDGRHNWIVRSDEGHRNGHPVLVGRLFRQCNFCHEVDRETALCEGMTADRSSRWPHYGTCGKVASFESQYRPSLIGGLETDGQTHHYCKVHDPETRKSRDDARNEASMAKYRAELDAKSWGWRGSNLKTAAEPLLEWAKANEDLVEGDEWLNQIVTNIREVLSK